MLRRIASGMLICTLGGAVLGCAGVRVYPVHNCHGSKGIRLDSEETSGVRFYRPAPHLWITLAGGGEDEDKDVSVQQPRYKFQIVWLPDYTQEYTVQWTAGFGSVKPGVTLTDGWNLTALVGEADSKVAENLTAVSALVGAGEKSVLVQGGAPLGPGLYRLRPGGDGRIVLDANPVFAFDTPSDTD